MNGKTGIIWQINGWKVTKSLLESLAETDGDNQDFSESLELEAL